MNNTKQRRTIPSKESLVWYWINCVHCYGAVAVSKTSEVIVQTTPVMAWAKGKELDELLKFYEDADELIDYVVVRR